MAEKILLATHFFTSGSEQQNTLLKEDRGTHSTIASRGNNPDLIPNPDTPGGNRKNMLYDLYDENSWIMSKYEAAVC